MTNPYRAPAVEADEALGAAKPGEWTVTGVLGQMLSAVRRQPLTAILAIVIVPTLWCLPGELLELALIPPETVQSGPDRSLRALAVSWAVMAWSTVCYPGQLLGALNGAEVQPIRFSDFMSGLRHVPRFLLMGALFSIPFELVSFLPLDPEGTPAMLAFTALLGLFLFVTARTVFWSPLLVRTTQGFWQSLAVSWAMTRGRSLRIFALGLVVGLLSLPAFALEAALVSADRILVSFSLMGAIYTLAAAQLYVNHQATTLRPLDPEPPLQPELASRR
jgi:hypothetical protein